MITELSPKLSTHLAALEVTPSDAAVEAAQHKLEARLLRPRRRMGIQRPWLGWVTAAASCCLVLALVMLPASQSIAFATVQKHLRDFTTLGLTIEQRSQGMNMPTIHVRMDHQGDARTDIGSASTTVVNISQHQILTLLHASHMAMQTPISPQAAARPADNLAWLDAIRRFQGKATRLPHKQTIDGRPNTGWALDTAGMHIVIWADADGLPRAININGGQVLSQRMHVSVDQPMDASIFSTQVPAGYKLLRPNAE